MEHDKEYDKTQGRRIEEKPKAKRRFAYGLMTTVLLGAGVVGGSLALLPSLAVHAEAQTAKSDATGPKDNDLFVDHSKQAGVTTCRELFSSLGSLAVADSSYRMATFWNQKAGNKHAIGTLAGLRFETPALRGQGAGVVYGAPVNGSCEGVSVRIVPVPGKCSDFVASLSNNVVQREDLNGVPLVMFASGAKVMAIETGANICVAVTTVFGNGALE